MCRGAGLSSPVSTIPTAGSSDGLTVGVTSASIRNIMERATRFSVSLDARLLRDLDRMRREKGYANRSQAIAEMIRGQLVEHRHRTGAGPIAGTITLVYDHHKPRLLDLLTDIQHTHGDLIIATLHVHLDHHNCLEVLAVRGSGARIRTVADALIGARGVKHGKLTITSTGKDLP